MARILVLYATVEGQTARIAERVAGRLRSAGHAVEVRDAAAGVDGAACDALIIGASVHYGHHPAWLRATLRRQREMLAARPAAFFSVSLSANPEYAAKLLRQVGWRPALEATFAGALKYSRYGWFKRRVVQVFARMGGHATDPSADYEYTDWNAVEAFATAFAARLG
jgi:menaquinone-dependent protoporphyrinogen oxidase